MTKIIFYVNILEVKKKGCKIVMKIRIDYITNSSSSSFIALNREDYSIDKLKEQLSGYKSIKIGKRGNREFSRFLSETRDFFSKLNFLSLSLLYIDDIKDRKDNWYRNFLLNKSSKFFLEDYKEILNQLIQKELNLILDWKLIKKMKRNTDAYIDHQSLLEGIPEILKDEDSMKRFLFNDKSIVVFDGDESGCCFQLLDKYFRLNKNYDYIDKYEEERGLSGFYLYISEERETETNREINRQILNKTNRDNEEDELDIEYYTANEEEIEKVRNEIRELVIDRDIPEVEEYILNIDIYRIDIYRDWYEEYIYNNYESIEEIADRISDIGFEEYKEMVKRNQSQIKRQILDKISNNSTNSTLFTLWIITCPYEIEEKEGISMKVLEELDRRFDRNELFRKDERLNYFREMD